MNQVLLTIAVQEAPAVFALIRSAFVKAHPELPPPTNEEILALFDAAFADSVATDDAILAALPPVV